jgi:hypothetical protein
MNDLPLMRKKFHWKIKPPYLNLCYNKQESRFHDFTILLKNMEKKKSKFGPDVKTITDFVSYVKPFREKGKANANTYSIIIFSSENEITKMNIPHIIGLLMTNLGNL